MGKVHGKALNNECGRVFFTLKSRRHGRTWTEGGGDALFLLLWFQTPHQMDTDESGVH